MNLRETVCLQLKGDNGISWFPTLALLEAPATMLTAGGYFNWNTGAQVIAGNVLRYLAVKDHTAAALADALEKNAAFMADVIAYESRYKDDGYSHRKNVEYCMLQGLNWLKNLGLCTTPVKNNACIYRIAYYGKSIVKVMRWHDSLLEALDLLTTAYGESKCVSAKEEKLACVLAGHAEWMEKQWLEQQMKWLSAIFYLQNEPCRNSEYWVKLLIRVFAVRSWHDKMVACRDAEDAKRKAKYELRSRVKPYYFQHEPL